MTEPKALRRMDLVPGASDCGRLLSLGERSGSRVGVTEPGTSRVMDLVIAAAICKC